MGHHQFHIPGGVVADRHNLQVERLAADALGLLQQLDPLLEGRQSRFHPATCSGASRCVATLIHACFTLPENCGWTYSTGGWSRFQPWDQRTSA